MAFLISAIRLLQAESPFFSNDITGILKVLVMVASIIGAIIGGYFKILKGNWRDEIRNVDAELKKLDQKLGDIAKDVTRDINGMGERVTRVDKVTERLDERVDQVSKEVDQHEFQLGTFGAQLLDIGNNMRELTEGLRAARDTVTEALRTEMGTMNEKFHDLDKRLDIFDFILKEKK